jgi:hypothetical protein
MTPGAQGSNFSLLIIAGRMRNVRGSLHSVDEHFPACSLYWSGFGATSARLGHAACLFNLPSLFCASRGCVSPMRSNSARHAASASGSAIFCPLMPYETRKRTSVLSQSPMIAARCLRSLGHDFGKQ